MRLTVTSLIALCVACATAVPPPPPASPIPSHQEEFTMMTGPKHSIILRAPKSIGNFFRRMVGFGEKRTTNTNNNQPQSTISSPMPIGPVLIPSIGAPSAFYQPFPPMVQRPFMAAPSAPPAAFLPAASNPYASYVTPSGSPDFHAVLDSFVRSNGLTPAGAIPGDQEMAASSIAQNGDTPVFSFKKLYSFPFYLNSDSGPGMFLTIPYMKRHIRRMSSNPFSLPKKHKPMMWTYGMEKPSGPWIQPSFEYKSIMPSIGNIMKHPPPSILDVNRQISIIDDKHLSPLVSGYRHQVKPAELITPPPSSILDSLEESLLTRIVKEQNQQNINLPQYDVTLKRKDGNLGYTIVKKDEDIAPKLPEPTPIKLESPPTVSTPEYHRPQEGYYHTKQQESHYENNDSSDSNQIQYYTSDPSIGSERDPMEPSGMSAQETRHRPSIITYYPDPSISESASQKVRASLLDALTSSSSSSSSQVSNKKVRGPSVNEPRAVQLSSSFSMAGL